MGRSGVGNTVMRRSVTTVDTVSNSVEVFSEDPNPCTAHALSVSRRRAYVGLARPVFLTILSISSCDYTDLGIDYAHNHGLGSFRSYG